MTLLHIVGVGLMIFVAGFGAYLFMGVSKLEKVIEAEIRDRGAE